MADKMARFGIRTLDRIYELAESEEGLWEESEMRRVSKLLFYFDEGGWKNAKRNTRVYESNLEEERGSFEVFDGEEALLVSHF